MNNLSVAKRADEAAKRLAPRPAGLGLQQRRTDAARARAHPDAELADRLPRQFHPQGRRLRNLRSGPGERAWCCAIATARSAAFTMSAGIAARGCWTARETVPATITCPYHGWTYRHDGGLIGMPVRESFPGLDRAEHGLRPVRTDIAFGFVFVCLAGDPPPVAKIWGKLAEEFLPYRFEEMVPLGPDHPGDLARRLENRDGQLSRVLSRAHRPSGAVSHVHAGLRGPGLGARRRARRQLAARAGLAALVGRPVSAA